MRLKTRRINQSILLFVLLTLLGWELAITLDSLSPVVAAEAPPTVVTCFPKVPPVRSAKLLFSVQQGIENYYLMSSDQSQGSSDLLISVNNQDNRCSLLLFNPMGDTLPLSRFVPMSVARQFALQQVKQGLAQAGSRAAYQQQVMQVEMWTPEEIWAVQQLGFTTPKKVKVIAPEDIKVSPNLGAP